MAFKLPQGRAPFLQTGRDIPSSMVSGSAMKQTTTASPQTDIELTVEYDKGKKKLAEARKNEEKKKGIEAAQGITIDAPTGTATPNLPMHKAVRAGSFMREIDSQGNVVQEVPYYDTSPTGGKAAEKLAKYVKDRNFNTTYDQTRNADLYNAMGGGTAPENLNEKQKNSLVGLGKAVVVNAPAKQRMKAGAKMPPAKQMKKKKC
jgi:hypothetical protein